MSANATLLFVKRLHAVLYSDKPAENLLADDKRLAELLYNNSYIKQVEITREFGYEVERNKKFEQNDFISKELTFRLITSNLINKERNLSRAHYSNILVKDKDNHNNNNKQFIKHHEVVIANKRPLQGLVEHRPNINYRKDTDLSYTWNLTKNVHGHTAWVKSLLVHPDNEYFFSGSSDSTVKVWCLATGELQVTLTGHIDAINSLAFNKNNNNLLSAGEDRDIRVWDLERGIISQRLHGHNGTIYSVVVHETGLIASASADRTIKLWDLRAPNELLTLHGHTDRVYTLATQATSPHLISGGADCNIILWDLNTIKAVKTLAHHEKSVKHIAVNPIIYEFATVDPSCVKIWHGCDFKLHRTLDLVNSNATKALFKQDVLRQHLHIFSNSKQFSVYDNLNYTQSPHNFNIHYKSDVSLEKIGTIDACLDRGETRLITAHMDNTIKIWNEKLLI